MSQSSNSQNQVVSLEDFDKTPEGSAERWATEMGASNTASTKFLKQGNQTVKRYLNQQSQADQDVFRLNLFNSNITTIKSMMFGKLPEIEFSRKNDDYEDDIARVAAMILQRMLNADIGKPNDQYSTCLRESLEDRLLPGLGIARVRYEFDKGMVDVAPVIDQQSGQVIQGPKKEEKITEERAPIDYVHWRDFRWSPARTWDEVRWVAFRTNMTQDEGIKRFGDKIGKMLPLTAAAITRSEDDENATADDPKQDAFKRSEVWEIWCKENRSVYWWCKGVDQILDTKEDPLKLTGFFPCPRPMISNCTTSAFMPIPDYILAQDSYNEIDQLETRISLLTEAVKVVGVYDQAAEGVKRMLTEGVENELIPVDNWAAFAEKGGLQGTIDWLPVIEIAGVLDKLIGRRNDCKAMLYEVTGISDIMRGAAKSGGAVSATERALEARFASVRIQALQDEFAKYATDLIRLRAEIVARHFQPESIVKQSNISFLPTDQQYVQAAVALIKEQKGLIWRINVKPESVAMVDYAQLKAERTDYITALATFMQSAAPLVKQEPAAAPILMEMLKWGLAGFKGSNEVEGILDQAIKVMQAKQKEPEGEKQPSPEEIKAQMEQQKQQFEQQKMQMQQQFEAQKQQHDMQLAQFMAGAKQQEIQADATADIEKEAAQATLNMQEKEKDTEEYTVRKQLDFEYDRRILELEEQEAIRAEARRPTNSD